MPASISRFSLGAVLWLYLGLFFLFPYKPSGMSLSPHSIVLLFGVIMLGVRLLREKRLTPFSLSPEDYLVIGLLFSFAVSTLVHADHISRVGLPAYIFSFLCYLFVRSAAKELNFKIFYDSVGIYLAVSGSLILLQVAVSDVFYVANYFQTANVEPAHQGWGFANFHVVAGGIVMWCLAVSVARYLEDTERGRGKLYNFFILISIVLGAMGLYYSSSRAAWLGTGMVFLALAVLCFHNKRVFYRLIAVSFLAISSVLFCGTFIPSRGYRLDDKIVFLRKITSEPLLTVNSDVSSKTKLKAWSLAYKLIRENPVWGIGVDQFPKYYEAAYSGIDTKLEGIDPEMNINASNSFLSYMAEVGLLPSLFLFGLIFTVFRKALTGGVPGRNAPFLLGFIAICFWALPADYLKERLFWISFGLLSSLPEK